MNDLTKVVVYWAECGTDKGWCFAAHYSLTEIETAPIPGGEGMTEDQAVKWAIDRFGVEAEIGQPDVI